MVHSREIEQQKRKLRLSRTQRDILVGVLLGDASLESQNGGRTYRLKIEQSLDHADYVVHLYEQFAAWVRRSPFRKTRRTAGRSVTESLAFNTLSHPAFRFYAQQFYDNQHKVVPKLIHRWLTDRGLAYWMMDDGSLKSKQSKAVILNTQCFSRRDVERLANVLGSQFQLQASLRRQKEGFQILISGSSLERLRKLVGPFLLESMQHKLPNVKRTHLPKE